METIGVVIRQGEESDVEQWLDLYEAVAAEGHWIGGEAPVDRPALRRRLLEGFIRAPEPAVVVLATGDGTVIGNVGLRLVHGVADLGMMVAADWRGRGVGSMLMEAALEWSRSAGAHKIALQLWPHNDVARRLYDKFGFVEEGRLRRHYRRRNGELWDAVIMGLVLDVTSPGNADRSPI